MNNFNFEIFPISFVNIARVRECERLERKYKFDSTFLARRREKNRIRGYFKEYYRNKQSENIKGKRCTLEEKYSTTRGVHQPSFTFSLSSTPWWKRGKIRLLNN